jgi:hypothetical protein
MCGSDSSAAVRRFSAWGRCAPAAAASILIAGLFVSCPSAAPQPPPPKEATTEEVHRLCAACHAYPPADSFPRSAWRREVKQGYDFFHEDPSYRFDYPPLDAVVRYYENRAPAALAELPRHPSTLPPRIRFDRQDLRTPAPGPPGITHLKIAQLSDKGQPDLLCCDAINRQVSALNFHTSAWTVLAQGLCCAHAEVVDLDGDGVRDVVLACLGSFYATDTRVGSVVWLRRSADGRTTPVTLLDGLGRVADVQAADFNGDGKLDLIVAEFGWRHTGSILLLENQTTDWNQPVFVPRMLDNRHGTTHVQVADLNRDGKPDFVAAISQEHETVVAFINEGSGRFHKETIYTAPHPAFGINGLQLADLDGDGDLDMLLTNGDALDQPYVLKPYHGLTWLENRGSYPFTPRRLLDCHGAGSPVVADFDGNGLLDIVVTVFLPHDAFPQREAQGLESVMLLEQAAPGKFERYVLERQTCDHLAGAAGDVNGDGRPDLVIGNFAPGGGAVVAVSVWRNITEKTARFGR